MGVNEVLAQEFDTMEEVGTAVTKTPLPYPGMVEPATLPKNAMGGLSSNQEVNFTMAEGCDDLTPTKAHEDDAGYDLKASHAFSINPGEIKLVKTGLFLELPVGYEGQVRPRSGLALKHGITVLNSPGTLDSSYRGEVGVILINHGPQGMTFNRGDRIAQLVIAQLAKVELVRKLVLSETTRGANGFGSTGVGAR